MGRVLVLLAVFAMAAPAGADEAVPQKATDVAFQEQEYASPAQPQIGDDPFTEGSFTVGVLTWFDNPAEFADAVARAGKRSKGTENFEESVTGPNRGVAVNDPLKGGVPNPPEFPAGLAQLNLTVQSNLGGGNPAQPNPRGASGLAHFTPPAGGFVTKVVIANFFVDSLDLIITPDDNCPCKTAIAGNPVRFTNAGNVNIRVYDVNNNLLGQQNFPNSPQGTGFAGVISNGPCIGRVNLHDPGNGAEGLDNIQFWCRGPLPKTCKYNSKVKAKGGCDACPPSNRDCEITNGVNCDDPSGCSKKLPKDKAQCPNGPGFCVSKFKRCDCN